MEKENNFMFWIIVLNLLVTVYLLHRLIRLENKNLLNNIQNNSTHADLQLLKNGFNTKK
jgi:hypothetical protein